MACLKKSLASQRISFDKKFYFILTPADTDKKNLYRTKEAGILYGIGVWNVGDVQNTPAYNDTYEMGKQVYIVNERCVIPG